MKKIISNLVLVFFLFHCTEKKKANLLPIALLGGLTTITTTQIANSSPDQNDTGSNSSSGSSSITTSATVATGHYSTPQTINFTSSVTGGVVKCTTDGNDPTNTTPTWTQTHIWAVAGATIKCGTFVNGTLSGSIQSYTYSYSPLASGQTGCWNTAGTSISCAGTGQDGATQNGVARSYTDNGDGTVTDNSTGAVWQKCSAGLSGTTCATGTAGTYTWANAGTYCSGLTLAGKTWRLPTALELETLPNYGTSNPAINITIFPNTVSGNYWSSNTYSLNSVNAWLVSFSIGASTFTGKTLTNYVRCISTPNIVYASKFNNNGNGTVTDQKTGLVWQRCSVGLSGSNCESGSATIFDWSTPAFSTCSGLSLAGRSWRLPSITELTSIIDKSLSSPSINSSAFPGTVFSGYTKRQKKLPI